MTAFIDVLNRYWPDVIDRTVAAIRVREAARCAWSDSREECGAEAAETLKLLADLRAIDRTISAGCSEISEKLSAGRVMYLDNRDTVYDRHGRNVGAAKPEFHGDCSGVELWETANSNNYVMYHAVVGLPTELVAAVNNLRETYSAYYPFADAVCDQIHITAYDLI